MFIGPAYVKQKTRLEIERNLILEVWPNCYNIHPDEGKAGINNPFYGKQHTEETKKSIGQKNQLANRGKRGKPAQIEFNQEILKFPSLSEAGRYIKENGGPTGGHKMVGKRVDSSDIKFLNWKLLSPSEEHKFHVF